MSMTPVEIINRSCIDKQSLTKEEADKYIDRKARKGIVLYYYKCSFCNRYHISKMDHTINILEVK